MLVHLIMEAGEIHSIIQSGDEADRYLEDLRRVHPDVEWSSEQFVIGRLPGHVDGCKWGYEAVYDMLKCELSFCVKAWVWVSQCSWQKRVNDKFKLSGYHRSGTIVVMDRYIPVYQDGSIIALRDWLTGIKGYFEKFGTVESVDDTQVKLTFK